MRVLYHPTRKDQFIFTASNMSNFMNYSGNNRIIIANVMKGINVLFAPKYLKLPVANAFNQGIELIDEVNPQNGIMELRVIDPRKIRKITNIQKGRDPRGFDIVTNVEEYYLYNNTGITEQTVQGIRLSKDSIHS